MAHPTYLLSSRVYKAKHFLARLVLLWESVWLAAAPAIGVAVAAVAAAMLEIPQQIGLWFGGWVHAVVLALVLLLLLWALRRAVVVYRAPDSNAILRRLESASGLSHRPLTALSDRLANGFDPRSQRLWDAYRRRIANSVRYLRVGPPRPILPLLDPFAVRAGIGIALIVAVVVAWDDPGRRLLAAVKPNFQDGAASRPATVDVWISPPAYTGKPPVLLTRVGGSAAASLVVDREPAASEPRIVPVPIGSKVLAAVAGGSGVPDMVIEDAAGGAADIRPFEAAGADSYRLEHELRTGASLAIRQDGDELTRWALNVIPDLQPGISFLEPPSVTQRESLLIHYEAEDDYGVASATAVIQLMTEAGPPSGADPMDLPMPIPGVGKSKVAGRYFNDLTPHPWAGQPVRIVLRATDEIGQIGESGPIDMYLPERIFRHPVARAVIEQRKRLVAKPGDRREVAKTVMTIAARPQQYDHDLVVFLSLKSAASRLVLNGGGAEDKSVIDLLWESALRIEDGELSVAERRLRELQQKLQKALAGNASDEEVEQLMNQLKEAIDKYLEALAKRNDGQQQQSQNGQMQPQETDNAMRRQDLQDMVDKMRDMARGGARDAASQMLSQLQEMMENLRMGNQSQMSPQQRAMQEMMRQLGEMTRQQQQLMDDTYKQHQNGTPQNQNGQGANQSLGQMGRQRMQSAPKFGEGVPRARNQGSPRQGQRRQGQGNQPGQNQQRFSAEELSRMQEQLRRALGEFMRKLSEGMDQIPQGFGKAERSMKDAVGALERSEPGDAVGPQGDALNQMQQGGRSLAEMMREQMANGQGTPQDQARGMQDGTSDDRDPLNRRRPGQGFYDRGTIGIPGESDVQKARRIFDELRRRSGDRDRPALELDYIDRLLRRF